METSVYFNDELQTVIPYHSVVSFCLFCEQQGLYTSWNQAAKRIDVFPHSKQEHIVLSTINHNQLSDDAVDQLKQFLSASGAIAVIQNGEHPNPKLIVKLDVSENENEKKPSLLIGYHSSIDERLRNVLLTELNETKISFQFKELPIIPHSSSRGLRIKYELPTHHDHAISKEQISLCLAKAFLRYVHNDQASKPFSYLPKDMVKNWLKNLTGSHGAFVQNQLEKKKQEEKEIETEETPKPLKSVVSRARENKAIKETKAEIFFDYTTLLPQADSENKEYLITGNLYLKNTGNEVLTNPVICIKVTPTQGVSLHGQIIPPRMVSGLAMKSNGIEKGWKYVYEDWRERVKTKGEYWITPIQPFQIPPGETATFNSFKVAINETEESTSVLVEGFVYFNEGKDQFSANNRISFTFLTGDA